MPLNITLKTDSEEYAILNCRYGFSRKTNSNGWPGRGITGGEIVLTMESTGSIRLLERFFGPDLKTCADPRPFAGTLEIYDVEDNSTVRTLYWEQGYISSVRENMRGNSPVPMTQTITISPLRLDIDHKIRLDRRFPQTYAFWWEEYKEEEVEIANAMEVLLFDEQIELSDQNGCPVPDVLYCFEYEGEIVLHGRTDSNGLTQRIPQSDTQHSYELYWGYVWGEYGGFLKNCPSPPKFHSSGLLYHCL